MGKFPTEALGGVWPLGCSLVILAGLAGSARLESRRIRPGDRTNSHLRSLLGWFLPAAIFLWVGTSISEWALLEDPSQGLRLVQATRICLVPGILSGILSQKLRFQPFALGLCLLGGLVLPLGLAMETFCGVFHRPFVDNGSLGMAMLSTSCFALAALPFLEISRRSTHSPPSDPGDVDGRLFLLLAWIAAAVSDATTSDDAARTVTTLLVAGAAALVGQLSFSWIRSGVVAPTGLLEAPLKGLLAVLPAAAILPPEAGAICGLLGLPASHGMRLFLRRCGFADELGTASIHLGGGLVGLLIAPFLSRAFPPGWEPFLTQWAVSLGFALLGGVTGIVSWLLLSWLTRLRLTAAEEPAGLDFSEHGVQPEAEAG